MVEQLLPIPDNLLNCAQPPTKLRFVGQALGREPKVAIVGTRRPSQEGQAIAFELAEALAKRRVTVISGLAMGIDSCAHRGALAARGRTVAVLPGGLKRIYPASNTALAREILSLKGTLISEFEPDHAPKPYDFLARNRIIAGLSELVIVVEAPKRSGALNTARHALEMGIDILAVPGSIKAVNSAGTNYLIKTGCAPLTAVEDVFEHLGMTIEQSLDTMIYSAAAKTVYNCLKVQPQTPEELAVKLQKSIIDIEQLITELEIDGVVTRLPGNLLHLRS